jgi:hypothetical protein
MFDFIIALVLDEGLGLRHGVWLLSPTMGNEDEANTKVLFAMNGFSDVRHGWSSSFHRRRANRKGFGQMAG